MEESESVNTFVGNSGMVGMWVTARAVVSTSASHVLSNPYESDIRPDRMV